MKDINKMSYKELIDLENQIKKLKTQSEDRLYKDRLWSCMDDIWYKNLEKRLIGEGFGIIDSDRTNWVVRDKLKVMKEEILNLCDITLKNYTKRPSRRSKTYSYRGDGLFCNSQLVCSANNKLYKNMAMDISNIIAKYLGELNEYEKGANNDY